MKQKQSSMKQKQRFGSPWTPTTTEASIDEETVRLTRQRLRNRKVLSVRYWPCGTVDRVCVSR